MYAAARFTDMPELHELRAVFVKKYGNSMKQKSIMSDGILGSSTLPQSIRGSSTQRPVTNNLRKLRRIFAMHLPTLVDEIEVIGEIVINENDDHLLAMTIGNVLPFVSEMDFPYREPEIHADLFCTNSSNIHVVRLVGEELKKALNIWTNFIKPMLGAPSATGYKSAYLENNSNRIENGQKMANLEVCVEDVPEDDILNGDLLNAKNASEVPGNAGGLDRHELRHFAEFLFSSEGGDGKSVAAANVIMAEATEAREHTNGSVEPLQVVREEADPYQSASWH